MRGSKVGGLKSLVAKQAYKSENNKENIKMIFNERKVKKKAIWDSHLYFPFIKKPVSIHPWSVHWIQERRYRQLIKINKWHHYFDFILH